jgi:tetratricopeptide (TPR) repeat protein
MAIGSLREESWVTRLGQGLVALVLTLGAIEPSCSCQTRETADELRHAAIVLEQNGDDAKAESAWRAVLAARPQSAEAYAHLGFLAAREQKYSDAIVFYRKALSLDPSMPGLTLNLGLSLFKSGQLQAAIQTLVPLLKKESSSSPEAQRLNVLIGTGYYAVGEYGEAIPYLKQATLHDPQSLELRLILVHTCLGAKQYQCVMDAYHEILLLNAESAEADMLAGEALDEMNNDPAAIQQFQAAIKANPAEPNVHFGLGFLLWKLKRYDEAAGEFEAELANVPNHVQALTYLGDSDIQLEQSDKALPLLERAVRMDRSVELAHLDLGILYVTANRANDALQEFQAAAKLMPDDVSVHYRLGRLYQTMGRKAEAKAEFTKTVNLHKAADEKIYNKISNSQTGSTPIAQESGASSAH